MTRSKDNLIQRWTNVGVLFNVKPRHHPDGVDVERLLVDTARACASNPRLFILAVTWLTENGIYVATHRLKRIATDELSVDDQAALGLLIDTAVEHGAPKSLSKIVCSALATASQPEPLFEVDRGPLASLIANSATPLSKQWGRWIQPIELKPEAVRPARWILHANLDFCARAAHKGDLRTSIVQTLRRDVGREAVSESDLARRCGATRAAVRAALTDLEHELAELRITRCQGRRGTQISLSSNAASHGDLRSLQPRSPYARNRRGSK